MGQIFCSRLSSIHMLCNYIELTSLRDLQLLILHILDLNCNLNQYQEKKMDTHYFQILHNLHISNITTLLWYICDWVVWYLPIIEKSNGLCKSNNSFKLASIVQSHSCDFEWKSDDFTFSQTQIPQPHQWFFTTAWIQDDLQKLPKIPPLEIKNLCIKLGLS